MAAIKNLSPEFVERARELDVLLKRYGKAEGESYLLDRRYRLDGLESFA